MQVHSVAVLVAVALGRQLGDDVSFEVVSEQWLDHLLAGGERLTVGLVGAVQADGLGILGRYTSVSLPGFIELELRCAEVWG